MKCKSLLFVILSLVISELVNGQDRIEYNMPRNVEKEVVRFIKRTDRYYKKSHRERVHSYAFCITTEDRYYSLQCFEMSIDSLGKTDFYGPTNRFLRVKDNLYPLYTDYDFMFCEKEPEKLLEFGARYQMSGIGVTRKRSMLFCGYLIRFDKKTYKIIKREDSGYHK